MTTAQEYQQYADECARSANDAELSETTARALSSVEQDDSAGELDAGEEISGEFVVARGDGPKVLEFVEEALDEIAFAIEREIASSRGLAVGLWGNHRGDLAPVERVDQRISVVSLVADQGLRIGAIDQRLRASQIVGLPWREHHIDRIAERIDQDVDFGGQSAARSADRLRAVFFRAPALCW